MESRSAERRVKGLDFFPFLRLLRPGHVVRKKEKTQGHVALFEKKRAAQQG